MKNASNIRAHVLSLAAAAITVTALPASVVHASPASPPTSVPAPAPAPVRFTAHTTDTASVISTDTGSISVEAGILKIKADDGTVLAGTPLTFRVDDFDFPMTAEISGRTAILTPQYDLGHATYRPVALPFEDKAPWKNEYDREQAAWSRLTSTIGMGATIGTLVGGLGGAAVGCVLGGVVGATVASATIIGLFGPFIPAAAIGCLGGVIAVGALGTVAGQLLVTAPVAIAAAIQYFSTLNSPPPVAPK